MNISIEEKSGFCFGVKRVIEMAESMLEHGEKVYCLGEIVHNEKEVKRLESKGMVFIDHADLDKLKDKTILIRAHGEPPETYEKAARNNLEIIDGTCPIVQRLQRKIRKRYRDSDRKTEQIIIYGKEKHPEVLGLKGQTNNEAIVVRTEEDLKKVERDMDLYIYSQTTMDTGGFEQISSQLKFQGNDERSVQVNDTICRHISHREPGLRKFASQNDLIIFVAGKQSSNGRILYEICRDENPSSIFISESKELKPEWFVDSIKSVGICGATSTPVWLLEEVAEKIKSFTEN